MTEKNENKKDAYLTDQIITYMGNKRKLLNHIGNAVDEIKISLKKDNLSIGDGFSGSGIVSRLLKTKSSKLYCNDIAGYSYTLNECYLASPSANIEKKIHKHIDNVNEIANNFNSDISEPWISENVNAIIKAWEPGSFGGLAVGEIIFGKTNPSGKLPLTIARSVGQLKMFYNHKPSMYFRDYAIQTNKPLYSFGYGLSYTKFQISEPELINLKFEEDILSVSVEVKNIGNVAGDEIVQLYISDKYSSVTRPVKELKEFQRVSLKPDESKVITFELDKSAFAFYDLDMNFIIEAGEFDIHVGNSSRDEDLKTTNFSVEKTIYLND